MVFGLVFTLLLLGFLLATDYVIALVPASEQFVEKIAPFKGWIGLGLALTGLWWTLNYVLLSYFNLFFVIKNISNIRIVLYYFTALLPSSLLMLGGGFLLGYDKIAELSGKGAELETVKKKILPYQTKIGVTSLFVAFWCLLISIAWRY